MKDKIKSIENVLEALSEKLYLSNTKKYQNVISELEETYNTVIVMGVEGLTKKIIEKENLFSNFQKKEILCNRQEINTEQQTIIEKLNKQNEIKAYSFLPTGLGYYEDLEELKNQLIRQSTLEEKKYIYVYIEDRTHLEEKIKDLTEELKEALLIIIGIKENETVPFLIWSQKEKTKSWVIRHPNENEYSPFVHMSKEFEVIFRKGRPDIYDGKVVYNKGEFNTLCNPHQLGTLLIYEEDHNILGFIEAQLETSKKEAKYKDSRTMRIKKIFVKKEYRRQKIATKLYEEVVKKAKEEKCDRIEVEVYSFTPEAKSFFTSLGLEILSYQYEIKVPQK